MTHSSNRPLIIPVLAGAFALFTVMSAAEAASGQSPQQEKPKATVHHQYLNVLAGEWITKSRLVSPAQKPIETTGKASIRPVLGGRFVLEERTGKLLGNDASTVRLYGYNTSTKRFEAVMAYAGSSALTTFSGTSTDGRTLTLSGVSTGKKGKAKTEMDIFLENPGSFTVTLRQPDNGDLVVTTVYKRAPKAPGKAAQKK
ncbi:MAG: hypothetical protein CMJ90_03650 [Planctomycetes bacterium]|nr:hypothetical protein [Planctomycetota bacterium]